MLFTKLEKNKFTLYWYYRCEVFALWSRGFKTVKIIKEKLNKKPLKSMFSKSRVNLSCLKL